MDVMSWCPMLTDVCVEKAVLGDFDLSVQAVAFCKRTCLLAMRVFEAPRAACPRKNCAMPRGKPGHNIIFTWPRAHLPSPQQPNSLTDLFCSWFQLSDKLVT